ncbi:hypothetical protein [Thiocapsa sp. UBA6158]|uniref:hypothetical protein n=1 Tax=Thiocapsa sp. UBA6158 TaxID=1947692 RepID=UPI0025D9FFA5|nr:hypothetical protein [Thiocapsa sp. UBA6158]
MAHSNLTPPTHRPPLLFGTNHDKRSYTAFITAFFQALFAAYIRIHDQKTREGRLITQIRLEHLVWGELLWAATPGTA